jgi:hypothetical protein
MVRRIGHIGWSKNVYKMVLKSEEKRPLANLGIDGRAIL